MAKKVYDEDGLDMQKTDWSGDESTGNLPVSGRLVEKYIKSIDDKATPTEELAAGETKAPASGAVFASLVGTVTNIDVTDSEDGTQYVMTVTQKDGEGGESDREVRFSKYSDDDKVVVNIDNWMPVWKRVPGGTDYFRSFPMLCFKARSCACMR